MTDLSNNPELKKFTRLADDDVQAYIEELRQSSDPVIAQFFSTKISELEVARMFGFSLATLRTHRARQKVLLRTWRLGRKPIHDSHDVVRELDAREESDIDLPIYTMAGRG